MYGYHVPSKKSFKKSIEGPHIHSNINAFQIFCRNPRTLKVVQYKEKEAEECKEYIIKNNLFLVSHSAYLFNTGTKDKWEDKIESAMNELLYSEKIGAKGSVFHVGKHLKQTPEAGIEIMFEFITEVIQKLQEMGSKSIYILETCASSGTELLGDLKDFGSFYHRFSEKQRKNFKICIDTCHVFSSGYSLKTKSDTNKFIDIVQKHIGWENILVIHLNDSKKDVGCCVDRHENLCQGCIGKDEDAGFRQFVKHAASLHIPLILETPHGDDDMYEVHAIEIEQIKKWIMS